MRKGTANSVCHVVMTVCVIGEELKILKLHDIYRFQIGKFMFPFKKGFLPDAFQEMFLLTSHIHRYNTRPPLQFLLLISL